MTPPVTTDTQRGRDVHRPAVSNGGAGTGQPGIGQRTEQSLGTEQSMAELVVTWLGHWLASGQVGRRGFLTRMIVAATALAVNPFDFILRPQSAYASVCGASAGCGSGWTVFCCSINGGANTCPPGSYPAGWWKVDDSAFCNDGPRYYIDCNRLPGARCGCDTCRSTDTCDRRRYCCNNFRYGQCNTQIAGVTEVVCRIVTCTAPWEWDPACSDTTLVENATRTHSAPCLPGRNPSPIAVTYQDLGLTGSVLGRPLSREGRASGGGRYRRYANGMILWHPDYGAHAVHGDIFTRYDRLRRELGPLGYPVTDVRSVGDRRGRLARFESGAIYDTDQTGAQALTGPVYAYYRQLGDALHASGLGYPTTGVVATPGGGQVARFERGMILWRRGSGAHEVHGPSFDLYHDLRTHQGPLGYPVADGEPLGGRRGRRQRFQGGAIYQIRGRGARAVYGAIHNRYIDDLSGHQGPLGLPVTSVIPAVDGGQLVAFGGGNVFWHPDVGAHVVRPPILDRYIRLGKASGRLGYPISDAMPTGEHEETVYFQHGLIRHDTRSGATGVRFD